jgi:hypothetical protein
VRGCPLDGIGEDVWRALKDVRWAEEAHYLPVIGGTLDQAASFMETLELAREAKAQIKRRQMDRMKRMAR